MSVLEEVRERLNAVEQCLQDQPQLAAEIRAVRQLLTASTGQWIGTVEAQRLLGVQSVNTVKAWARGGFLRSRQQPNGRLQVALEDVLRERQAQTIQDAFPDDAPVTPEEQQAARTTATPTVQAVLGDLAQEPRGSRQRPGAASA